METTETTYGKKKKEDRLNHSIISAFSEWIFSQCGTVKSLEVKRCKNMDIFGVGAHSDQLSPFKTC